MENTPILFWVFMGVAMLFAILFASLSVMNVKNDEASLKKMNIRSKL